MNNQRNQREREQDACIESIVNKDNSQVNLLMNSVLARSRNHVELLQTTHWLIYKCLFKIAWPNSLSKIIRGIRRIVRTLIRVSFNNISHVIVKSNQAWRFRWSHVWCDVVTYIGHHPILGHHCIVNRYRVLLKYIRPSIAQCIFRAFKLFLAPQCDRRHLNEDPLERSGGHELLFNIHHYQNLHRRGKLRVLNLENMIT